MKHPVSRFLSLAALAGLAACAGEGTAPNQPTTSAAAPTVATPRFATTATGATSYILTARSANSLPANLAARVAAAGGTLTTSWPQIGVATAQSSDPAFAARAGRIAGLQSVDPDQMVQWLDPKMKVTQAALAPVPPAGNSIGDDEPFFGVQWAPKAIHAPEAWDLGARGSGVRVAVLDGGMNPNHVDLAGQVDLTYSASFVPGKNFDEDTPAGGFWHAVHVAGIVAAAHNEIGTIGVAPGATIISVKVLDGGSGSFAWVIGGIIYASTPIDEGGAGANIINMSLGALFPLQGSGAARLVNALGRATMYAYQEGTTVIASAGNDYTDLDHTANLISVPAQSPGVIAVSATGPIGFAYGATNYTSPATYTNYGQSAITLSAPGGNDAAYPLTYFYYDFVLSPGSGSPVNTGYYFAEGTSMAAPHVAGVAALIIEKNGGHMFPAQVLAALQRSADDLGKPGVDDYYGRGFVDALNAVE